MASRNEKKIERRRLEELKPHPGQHLLFGEPSPHELQELADDMKRNGQLHPVEILPNGTIIAGHRRAAAAQRLGWSDIEVWIRDDLAGNEPAAECRLIDDNLNRRQLSKLGMARCYKRRKQLESGRPHARLADYEHRELRDRMGKILKVSGRTLDRYLRILDHTPKEVQDAFDADEVPMTIALQVASLRTPQKEQIAAAIRAGSSPRKVIDEYLQKAPPTTPPWKETKMLVHALKRAVKQLGERVKKVGSITLVEKQSLLKGAKLIQELLATAKVVRPPKTSNGKTWIDEAHDLVEKGGAVKGRGRRGSADPGHTGRSNK